MVEFFIHVSHLDPRQTITTKNPQFRDLYFDLVGLFNHMIHILKRTIHVRQRPSRLLGSLHCRCLSSKNDLAIETATNQAFRLLEHKTLTPGQQEEAHAILDTLNRKKATSVESILASLRLLAFLGREGNPGAGDNFNAILHRWRSAKLFGQNVPNPRQICQSLRAFQHDTRSFSIIASVQAWMAPLDMKHVALEQVSSHNLTFRSQLPSTNRSIVYGSD